VIKIFQKNYLFLATGLIFLISFFLYRSSFNYYFFQDDFFEINISKAETFGQYLNFFKFRADIIAYRPISLQNYFFISSKIFGLEPTGFRLITFILFFSSAILIIKVIKKITGDVWVGLLTAFFWLTSSIHFMAITWIAATYNIIGTFFWLLTSFFFLNFLAKQKPAFYLLTIISFLVTIGSFEFSITWPIIFGLYYFFVLNKSLAKVLKVFSPFIVVSFIYLILRFFLIKIPPIIEYQTVFNIESFKAFVWYGLWTLNIPDEFKKQVVNNFLVFNGKFLLDYWQLVVKTFVGAVWTVVLGFFLPAFYIIKQKIPINLKLVVFSLVWYCLGVAPVLILPNHTFPMYLTLASIGFYLFLAYFLILSRKRLFIVLILPIWLITSFVTLDFYKSNYWMIEAQRFAKEFTFDIKKEYPSFPKNTIVFFPHPDKRHVQALSEENAIKAIYNDQSLSIYYNKKDLVQGLKEKAFQRPISVFLHQ